VVLAEVLIAPSAVARVRVPVTRSLGGHNVAKKKKAAKKAVKKKAAKKKKK
jgi:hypothetical protein